MTSPQDKIDKARDITRTIARIALGVLLVMLIPMLFKSYLTEYSWYSMVSHIYEIAAIILFVVFIFFGILFNILDHWATDEDELEFKQTIKEAVREVQKEKQVEKNDRQKPVESPLTEQALPYRESIEELLRKRVANHPKDYSRFKASQAQYFLVALQELNYLNPKTNPDTLREWLENVTGKFEPTSEYAHFREGYAEQLRRVNNKSNTQVRNAIKQIENAIAKN